MRRCASSVQIFAGGGTVAQHGIGQQARMEIHDRREGAADVEHVAVGEQQAIEPVDAPRAQIRQDDAVVVRVVAAIEQPVAAIRAHVRGAAVAEIEDGQFAPRRGRGARIFDVEITAGQIGGKVQNGQHGLGGKPIGVVEKHGGMQRERRR